jgi:pilus assembly protein CpaB
LMDGGTDRLEHRIPVGMRAASVSVNDVTSVAGFARPGSLVDVLVTGPTPDARRLQSMTVLQRVRVLASGNEMEGSPSKEGRDARVVTLLVTPEDAERLALATQQGRVQLVIRNPLDGSQDKRTPIDSLGGVSPARNRVRVKYVPAPEPAEHEIELHRGDHVDRIKVKN